MKRLVVRHSRGEYVVHIGDRALGVSELVALTASRPALIVTDQIVGALWLDAVRAKVPHAEVLCLPAGESAKTLSTAADIWSALARLGFGRDAVLIALGGGVIGDITGFAAACWMRGVDFIQLPTTLLAQVDASVGGKTAVDLPEGKNLVGAFHQPLAVFADTRTLVTLSDRDLAAGVAEIVKAALIGDANFLDWLDDNVDALRRREPAVLAHAIHRSCGIKADIVVEDERERGRRALLNLGHTFGHALENVTGYTRFLHGEAVAIGLVLAARLSEIECGLDTAVRGRLIDLLSACGLPTSVPPDISTEALLRAMRLDKKHVRSRWRLVLLESPGCAVLREFADAERIRAVLDARSG